MNTHVTSADDPGWAPDSCSLPTAERPLRIAEFDDLFATSLRAVERVGSTTTRLILKADAIGAARGLAARESSCCTFFSFEFAPNGAEQIAMLVTVPGEQVGVLDALTVRARAAAGLAG